MESIRLSIYLPTYLPTYLSSPKGTHGQNQEIVEFFLCTPFRVKVLPLYHSFPFFSWGLGCSAL